MFPLRFLGKLHNLARAVADEEAERGFMKSEAYPDMKAFFNYDKDGVLGLGLRASKQSLPSSAANENSTSSSGYDIKDTGKRLFGPLNSKSSTYLSQFILHIAAIGDIVDGTDTTHDFNYFSLVYEWPKDVGFLFCATKSHILLIYAIKTYSFLLCYTCLSSKVP